MLYYIILYYIVLYCIILYYIIVLYHIILNVPFLRNDICCTKQKPTSSEVVKHTISLKQLCPRDSEC